MSVLSLNSYWIGLDWIGFTLQWVSQLQTCYGETGVMDFDLYTVAVQPVPAYPHWLILIPRLSL